MSCPICRAPGLREFRPFCSRRCADIDLARWLKGAYSIPTDESPEQDGTPPQAEGEDGRLH